MSAAPATWRRHKAHQALPTRARRRSAADRSMPRAAAAICVPNGISRNSASAPLKHGGQHQAVSGSPVGAGPRASRRLSSLTSPPPRYAARRTAPRRAMKHRQGAADRGERAAEAGCDGGEQTGHTRHQHDRQQVRNDQPPKSPRIAAAAMTTPNAVNRDELEDGATWYRVTTSGRCPHPASMTAHAAAAEDLDTEPVGQSLPTRS